jgi:hypothetical protein
MAWANEDVTKLEMAGFGITAKHAEMNLKGVAQIKCKTSLKGVWMDMSKCYKGVCGENWDKQIVKDHTCTPTSGWKTKWLATKFARDPKTGTATMAWSHPACWGDEQDKACMKMDGKYHFMQAGYVEGKNKLLMATRTNWTPVTITGNASTLAAASAVAFATAALLI